MATAVILGGGISSLSAAYYLQRFRADKFSKIILLEGTDRLGGWIKSIRTPDGAVFECGPRSLRPQGKSARHMLNFVTDIGLTEETIHVTKWDDAGKNRYIYYNKKLNALPNNFMGMLRRQDPFTESFMKVGYRDIFNKSEASHEESIHEFMQRRFSKEMADIMADAFCRGIFAGDCRKLSIKACFPKLVEYEEKEGSIIMGMVKESGAHPRIEMSSPLWFRYKDQKWRSYSFNKGMEQMVDAVQNRLVSEGGVDIRLNSPVKSIDCKNGGGPITVKTENETFEADVVFSGILAQNLSKCLQDEAKLSEKLSEIKAVDCAVINLEYDGNVMPIQGFGHLLPSIEGGPVLGVIYDSCAFPEHDRTDRGPESLTTRLTVMLGGAWAEELKPNGQWISDDKLLTMATNVVKQHLGISATPLRQFVSVLKNCIPQYTIGHSDLVSNIKSYLGNNKIPLRLIGASYLGVSVNDCVYHAREEVIDVVRDKKKKKVTYVYDRI